MLLCLLLSPVKDTVVTNDRWCDNGCRCQHGGVFTCHDRYNPGESSCDVFLAAHVREGCSQPFIFSYFYSSFEYADGIMTEQDHDASAKQET